MFPTRTALCLIAATLMLGVPEDGASAASKKKQVLQGTAAAAAATTLTGKPLHGAAGPDLVIVSVLPEPDPVEGLPNQGYCSKVPSGGPADEVLFAVRNNGDAPSPLTTVRVTFATGQSDDKTIVALAPGQMSHVHINIPDGCYPATAHGSCNYAIAADADTQVNESSESNNVVLSLCLLPGT